MHSPQHLPEPQQQQQQQQQQHDEALSHRPVIVHRSGTQQRYAKSRFLMRLPRRHRAGVGEGGDNHHHSQEDYDFVDSLLEADEDTTFIDNLIGASSRKKQEDLENGGNSSSSLNHHYLETTKQQPLRRIRLVGRRLLYSFGAFIILYAFLSFRQSRKTKWVWRNYKENMHQSFASFSEQQQFQQRNGGGGVGVGGVYPNSMNNNNHLQYSNPQQGRMQYDPSALLVSQQQTGKNQALAGFWAGRDDMTAARLPPQLSGDRFVSPLNGYPTNNNNMIHHQQQPSYGLGTSSIMQGPDSFATASSWLDNKAGLSSSSSWHDGKMPLSLQAMGGLSTNSMEGANPNMLRRPFHAQSANAGSGGASSGNNKRGKGWRLLRKKEKPNAAAPHFQDAALAAAAAVKASSSMMLDPRAQGGGTGNSFVMGNSMNEQLRRPYAHGYD